MSDLESTIEKLSINPGDVVVIKLLKPIANPEDHHLFLNKVRAIMDESGFNDNLVICLPPGMDISVLDEQAMREAGWVSIARI